MKRILSLSRPRFWIYELGPYFIGLIAATHGTDSLSSLFSWAVLLFAIYFLFPANLYIYGINDIFDYETDKLNPKKVAYENLLMPSEHLYVFKWIALTNLPFIIILPFASTQISTLLAFVLFLFFAGYYSVPPIRAKARPFLDSMFSASHYVTTAVFAYLMAGGDKLNTAYILGGLAWCIAMHAYSAIPDIDADKKAGLATIATKLGKQRTLLVCGALYALSAFILSTYAPLISIFFGLSYLSLMALSWRANEERIFTLYTYFPKLNTLAGAAISLTILSRVLGF